ncbi:MAG TPA: hypothetical protein DEF47_13750 [Herpetosiphon sp.]|uniref:Core-binding (CB) domain-containing protein n=1 Tax=Herpetosiphon aurantiacus (strain ATCC 23779 / DSM 785 / 114-95) TaxID=316274 RepID=A9AZ22_HERA2|nr:hypothetical protein [Herpetosiphon sp.]ABX07062.1 hypothetical protein Haur_4430 [Herpetosiphon aurantiacus DSM 785]HBW50953.1 hypothetical protein [Herpetosiphon sp.]
MTMQELLVHERTLLGALDSFAGTLVRTRPQLAADYNEYLDDFAQRWIDSGYPNELDSISTYWVQAYLSSLSLAQREVAKAALHSFFDWAVSQGLIDQAPLSGGYLS